MENSMRQVILLLHRHSLGGDCIYSVKQELTCTRGQNLIETRCFGNNVVTIIV